MNTSKLQYLAPDFLPNCLEILKKTGKVILDYYNFDKFEVTTKQDDSPLTSADIASHKIITSELQKLYPNIPIISEEQKNLPFSDRKNWETFWLIDPIDGTKEFIEKNDEFTVNIALIHNHVPIFGAIHAPALDVLYYGYENQSFKVNNFLNTTDIENNKISIKVKKLDINNITIATSRRHNKEKLSHLINQVFPKAKTIPKGSSLKMCLIAEGIADIYLRLGPTSEWDIGAGQAILNSAGGEIYDITSNILRYNTKDSLLNPELYAIGDTNINWKSYIEQVPK
tara:strand:+ start:11507 stop:12358 length:852 start_codon:yes stop_codon:yes gene_type:complete